METHYVVWLTVAGVCCLISGAAESFDPLAFFHDPLSNRFCSNTLTTYSGIETAEGCAEQCLAIAACTCFDFKYPYSSFTCRISRENVTGMSGVGFQAYTRRDPFLTFERRIIDARIGVYRVEYVFSTQEECARRCEGLADCYAFSVILATLTNQWTCHLGKPFAIYYNKVLTELWPQYVYIRKGLSLLVSNFVNPYLFSQNEQCEADTFTVSDASTPLLCAERCLSSDGCYCFDFSYATLECRTHETIAGMVRGATLAVDVSLQADAFLRIGPLFQLSVTFSHRITDGDRIFDALLLGNCIVQDISGEHTYFSVTLRALSLGYVTIRIREGVISSAVDDCNGCVRNRESNTVDLFNAQECVGDLSVSKSATHSGQTTATLTQNTDLIFPLSYCNPSRVSVSFLVDNLAVPATIVYQDAPMKSASFVTHTSGDGDTSEWQWTTPVSVTLDPERDQQTIGIRYEGSESLRVKAVRLFSMFDRIQSVQMECASAESDTAHHMCCADGTPHITSLRSCAELEQRADDADANANRTDTNMTYTYEEGVSVCQQMGARLCSFDELQFNMTTNGGFMSTCFVNTSTQADKWTLTQCNKTHVYTFPERECAPMDMSNSTAYGVSCCADSAVPHPEWLLLAHQIAPSMWPTEYIDIDTCCPRVFSQMDSVDWEHFRDEQTGVYTFLMEWPNTEFDSLTWRQSSPPFAQDAQSVQHDSSTEYVFGGLQMGDNRSLVVGSADERAYVVGHSELTAIPGPLLKATGEVAYVNEVKLWIRAPSARFSWWNDTTTPVPSIAPVGQSITDEYPIRINVTFNEAVYDFTESSVALENGSILSIEPFADSRRRYAIEIHPLAYTRVSLHIREGTVMDTNGLPNRASNTEGFLFVPECGDVHEWVDATTGHTCEWFAADPSRCYECPHAREALINCQESCGLCRLDRPVLCHPYMVGDGVCDDVCLFKSFSFDGDDCCDEMPSFDSCHACTNFWTNYSACPPPSPTPTPTSTPPQCRSPSPCPYLWTHGFSLPRLDGIYALTDTRVYTKGQYEIVYEEGQGKWCVRDKESGGGGGLCLVEQIGGENGPHASVGWRNDAQQWTEYVSIACRNEDGFPPVLTVELTSLTLPPSTRIRTDRPVMAVSCLSMPPSALPSTSPSTITQQGASVALSDAESVEIGVPFYGGESSTSEEIGVVCYATELGERWRDPLVVFRPSNRSELPTAFPWRDNFACTNTDTSVCGAGPIEIKMDWRERIVLRQSGADTCTEGAGGHLVYPLPFPFAHPSLLAFARFHALIMCVGGEESEGVLRHDANLFVQWGNGTVFDVLVDTVGPLHVPPSSRTRSVFHAHASVHGNDGFTTVRFFDGAQQQVLFTDRPGPAGEERVSFAVEFSFTSGGETEEGQYGGYGGLEGGGTFPCRQGWSADVTIETTEMAPFLVLSPEDTSWRDKSGRRPICTPSSPGPIAFLTLVGAQAFSRPPVCVQGETCLVRLSGHDLTSADRIKATDLRVAESCLDETYGFDYFGGLVANPVAPSGVSFSQAEFVLDVKAFATPRDYTLCYCYAGDPDAPDGDCGNFTAYRKKLGTFYVVKLAEENHHFTCSVGQTCRFDVSGTFFSGSLDAVAVSLPSPEQPGCSPFPSLFAKTVHVSSSAVPEPQNGEMIDSLSFDLGVPSQPGLFAVCFCFDSGDSCLFDPPRVVGELEIRGVRLSVDAICLSGRREGCSVVLTGIGLEESHRAMLTEGEAECGSPLSVPLATARATSLTADAVGLDFGAIGVAEGEVRVCYCASRTGCSLSAEYTIDAGRLLVLRECPVVSVHVLNEEQFGTSTHTHTDGDFARLEALYYRQSDKLLATQDGAMRAVLNETSGRWQIDDGTTSVFTASAAFPTAVPPSLAYVSVDGSQGVFLRVVCHAYALTRQEGQQQTAPFNCTRSVPCSVSFWRYGYDEYLQMTQQSDRPPDALQVIPSGSVCGQGASVSSHLPLSYVNQEGKTCVNFDLGSPRTRGVFQLCACVSRADDQDQCQSSMPTGALRIVGVDEMAAQECVRDSYNCTLTATGVELTASDAVRVIDTLAGCGDPAAPSVSEIATNPARADPSSLTPPRTRVAFNLGVATRAGVFRICMCAGYLSCDQPEHFTQTVGSLIVSGPEDTHRFSAIIGQEFTLTIGGWGLQPSSGVVIVNASTPCSAMPTRNDPAIVQTPTRAIGGGTFLAFEGVKLAQQGEFHVCWSVNPSGGKPYQSEVCG
ncbi:unnamed protein product [Vitrella brassicaformis CCMP3155]|uniref:Uncharacterized protein n=2 Tax=Vitrella brassicaformis TaxID=1169539 RepID=A0A0G4GTV8_VITBC|nr:unnamed protein product [Vitrella brassicaformis CCMP3155]|eukprot:CEM34043.1 unnamed protein product [Vitrella brassicaformis CCMP3155]